MSDLQNMSSEELLNLARSPGMQLMLELSRSRDSGFNDPDRSKKVIQWTRSFKPDHPQFNHPETIKTDLRHLGFFTDDGTLKWDLVDKGKAFLDDHTDEKPDYPVFWRYLNVQLGRVKPLPESPDFSAYNELVAELIDNDTTAIEITKAIVKADQDGVTVPTFSLWKADRIQMILKSYPELPKTELEKELLDSSINWFSPDSVATAMRTLLKNQNYGLGEEEVNAWLDDQGNPSIARQLRGFFGYRNKAQTLQDLGILDANWKWSEVGFQRFQKTLKTLNASENRPNLCLLRWKLFQQFHANEPIPFEWALMNDRLSITEIHRARRIVSIALSGGMLRDEVKVGQTISPEQYEILRKVGDWINDQAPIRQWTALEWVSLLCCDPKFTWDNWMQICSFLYDKLDQSPDPELILDWAAGIVTFEGRGRYQKAPTKPFKANKVGRNEPCPCQSGKKYKKCCGR